MEGVANSLLKSREVRRVVLASNDERVVSDLRDSIGPHGVEIVPFTEFGLPDPSHFHGARRTKRRDDALLSATSKASVVATMTDMPTIGLARGFYIDPMLRWGGGGPQRYWPIPWPWASEELARELGEADDALIAYGCCGPDDRGAYFRTVLCLVWPDAESQTFEGLVEGQFQTCNGFNRPRNLVADPAQYFVPEGEAIALAHIGEEKRRQYSDQQRAFEAFRSAVAT
jgi:inosine/xanthosine triphosphate pyrophosphatase family protein